MNEVPRWITNAERFWLRRPLNEERIKAGAPEIDMETLKKEARQAATEAGREARLKQITVWEQKK